MNADNRLNAEDRAKDELHRTLSFIPERERSVLDHLIHRRYISRNVNEEFTDSRTFGERLADGIVAFGGSWTFILLFAVLLTVWITANSVLLARTEVFDPYPFILLNLCLSMLAAAQGPIIMMSQNRQAAKDRMNAAHDYEVNLKAELEIRSLHEKIDFLREESWAELLQMQRDQLSLMERLLERSLEETGGGAHTERGSRPR